MSSPSNNDLKKALDLHNQARSAKGNSPLTWSATLTAHAQAWADHCISVGKSEHADSSVTKEGENLGHFPNLDGQTVDNPAEIITNSWLAEEQTGNYHGEPISYDNYGQVGHYTQCVWNKSTQVGIAIAKDRNNIHVVARYNPQGNLLGAKPY
ncbi:CAP domain-containing protein [Rhypophila decipiens]|uniref:CAP domain-containing protein n=1 Tax=Rhypophila decipiens TaxID=261697 RepID=A0AAN6YM35_9PEZI|nr:CAP domain-containing protein [Rhypophila decipiens]